MLCNVEIQQTMDCLSGEWRGAHAACRAAGFGSFTAAAGRCGGGSASAHAGTRRCKQVHGGHSSLRVV